MTMLETMENEYPQDRNQDRNSALPPGLRDGLRRDLMHWYAGDLSDEALRKSIRAEFRDLPSLESLAVSTFDEPQVGRAQTVGQTVGVSPASSSHVTVVATPADRRADVVAQPTAELKIPLFDVEFEEDPPEEPDEDDRRPSLLVAWLDPIRWYEFFDGLIRMVTFDFLSAPGLVVVLCLAAVGSLPFVLEHPEFDKDIPRNRVPDVPGAISRVESTATSTAGLSEAIPAVNTEDHSEETNEPNAGQSIIADPKVGDTSSETRPAEPQSSISSVDSDSTNVVEDPSHQRSMVYGSDLDSLSAEPDTTATDLSAGEPQAEDNRIEIKDATQALPGGGQPTDRDQQDRDQQDRDQQDRDQQDRDQQDDQESVSGVAASANHVVDALPIEPQSRDADLASITRLIQKEQFGEALAALGEHASAFDPAAKRLLAMEALIGLEQAAARAKAVAQFSQMKNEELSLVHDLLFARLLLTAPAKERNLLQADQLPKKYREWLLSWQGDPSIAKQIQSRIDAGEVGHCIDQIFVANSQFAMREVDQAYRGLLDVPNQLQQLEGDLVAGAGDETENGVVVRSARNLESKIRRTINGLSGRLANTQQ